MKFGEWWRPSGTIGRGTYALIGLLGFALKHNLDRFVASFGFHRPWGLFNYWGPGGDVSRITELSGNEAVFLGTMVALSLPFIWLGVVLTMKRLRSAGLPTHLLAVFFLPFLNLLFFVILCLWPERDPSRPQTKVDPRKESSLTRIFPESALGSAAVSLLITVPVGFGAALLGTQVLANYGWGLFVALPFIMGFAAALVFAIPQARTLSGCVGVACLSTILLGAALLALAFEGIVCLIMATPIALPLAAFGGICAYRVQKRRRFHTDAPVLLSALLLFIPGIEWAEHVAAPPSPTFVVHSAIDVQARPEKVWHEVVGFSEIP